MLTHSVAGSNKIDNWTIATVPFSPPSPEQYGTDDRTFFDRESYQRIEGSKRQGEGEARFETQPATDPE
jgi:hypothetical protein